MNKHFLRHELHGFSLIRISAISLIILIFSISQDIYSQPKFSEIAVKPGAFSRMGFGAREIEWVKPRPLEPKGTRLSCVIPALFFYQKVNSFRPSDSI